MYARCGALAKAAEVLDGLPNRDAVSWSALIAGYAQGQHGREAINCFEQMQHEGLRPDAVTLVSVLKACGSIGALERGEFLHSEILRHGLLDGNAVLGGALVDMYAKCGALAKAKDVLERLPICDVISWNALIIGYVQRNQGSQALDCFAQMQNEGFFPNEATFVSILKACSSIGALDQGENVHSEIVRQGLLAGNSSIGSALLDMYAKCGALAKAKEVLDGLPVQSVASWNVLIAGYVQREHCKEALNCFEQMQREGPSPDSVTFASILKACGNLRALERGKLIHSLIAVHGLLVGDMALSGALVDMYVGCGMPFKAKDVLEGLAVRDVVSWNALISGYVHGDYCKEALDCFDQMLLEGLFPNAVTFIHILKVCGRIGALDIGEHINSEIVRQRLLVGHVELGGALVDMFVKCGEHAKAKEVLLGLQIRDAVSWSTLISGYAQREHGKEALDCFESMHCEGFFPDAVTFTCLLKAYGSISALDKGENLHCEIVKQGLLDGSVVLGGALVDMYTKCGALAKAKDVLEGLSVRDVATWNSLIAGYVQGEFWKEALACSERMQHEGLFQDEVTFSCVLKACGSMGALYQGVNLHSEIVRQGLLGSNVVLGVALVDMYSRCGAFVKAKEVFEELPFRNVALWNALITGYAESSCANEALNCFEQLHCEGLFPDEITFVCVLNACGHSGLVNEGQNYFTRMSRDYSVMPTSEHYACMINLFGHIGFLEKAVAVVKKMVTYNDPVVLITLLSACIMWGNVSLGRWAFEYFLALDAKAAASYVHIIDVYAAAGRMDEANKVKA